MATPISLANRRRKVWLDNFANHTGDVIRRIGGNKGDISAALANVLESLADFDQTQLDGSEDYRRAVSFTLNSLRACFNKKV